MEHRPPLSQTLESLLDNAGDSDSTSVTLNQLVERTEGRGLYLFLVLISLPTLTPIPLPGFSLIIGAVIIVVGLRIVCGLPPRLPLFIGNRQIPVKRQRQIISASIKWVKYIERMAKPRGRGWIANPVALRANAFLIALLGVELILPIPLPFTNSLPALAVIILCISIMEEDALLVWAGYVFAAASVIYLIALSGVIMQLFHKSLEMFHHFFA